MKYSNSFFAFAATVALLSAASCTDEPIITFGDMESTGHIEKVTVTATLPENVEEGFKTEWAGNDILGIFDPSNIKGPRDFQLKEGANSTKASFEGNLPLSEKAGTNGLYAIYPYDWYTGSSFGAESYLITIPVKQTEDLKIPQYMSGMSSDRNSTIELKPVLSILEISIGKIPEDETLTGMTLLTADGSPLFATTASLDLTSEEQTLTVVDKSASISSSIVSGDKVIFNILPQEFESTEELMIRSVITTNKSVYDQNFKNLSVKLAKGERGSASTDLLDRYGEGGFVFAENETARPGEGEWSGFDVIPVRGEIVNKEDGTPYSFLPNAGFSSSANPVLRIWFISKQGTSVGKWFTLKAFEGGFGFNPDVVKTQFTGESVITGIEEEMEWDANKHYFFSLEDAEKYKVTYCDFTIDSRSKFIRLFKEEFTLECTLGGEGVSDGHNDSRLPYNDLTVPVSVHATPSYLHITAQEEARIREYLENQNYNFIPLRGEYVQSKTDFTPYTFTVNVPAPEKPMIGFRMFVAVKRDYVVTNGGDIYTTKNTTIDGELYILGGKVSELAEKFGTGSVLGVGANDAAKNLASSVPGYVFESDELNDKYLLSYTTYDVNKPKNQALAPEGCVLKQAGKEFINIYLTKHKNNKDTNAPASLECPVLVTCVTAE
ncbi:MAG: hypothetical protein ACI395_03950 [Candidatus Cryptobacteroides sp.]